MRRTHVRSAVGVLIVAAFLGVGYLVHASLESQKQKQVDRSSLDGMLPDAVQWIQNFHRIEIRDGKKSWELEADEAQYLEDQNQVVVRNPRTTFYIGDGEQVTASGSQGLVEFKGKDLQKATLEKAVEIHVRGFVVRAEHAIYDRDADRIVANGPVTIDGAELRVAGNDMVVFVKESRFELKRPVRVTVLAKRPEAPSRS